MANLKVSDFFAKVGADKALTLKFLVVTEGKHSAEALGAIADFAQEIGFDLTFDDIRTIRSTPLPRAI